MIINATKKEMLLWVNLAAIEIVFHLKYAFLSFTQLNTRICSPIIIRVFANTLKK